jgi:chromosome segregation ATPase
MTKEQLQKELQEKVKAGVKPSDLKKLKRSKSADDIPSPTPNIPLKKSHSHLEIPLPQQPSLSQQVKQLKQNLLFTQNTADNYLQSLQLAQAQIIQLQEQLKVKPTKNQSSQTEPENSQELKQKINQLEEQILQLRLDKITEFGEYYEKKQELTQELDENITTGIQEIQRLENKLNTVNKKKLELQSQLAQSHQKNAQLELKLINELMPEPGFNY